MSCRRLAVAVILLLTFLPFSLSGQSQEQKQESTKAKALDYSKEAFILEEYTTRVRWEADGTGRSETLLRVKVQSAAGVQQLGELPLGYNSANQKLTVDYVRVHKADGSVVTAAADAVKDLTAPISREAPMYTDFRQKTITVQGLRPGDTLEYKFTIVTDPPLAPGHFWGEYNFEKNVIVLDQRLEINVPKGVALKIKTEPGAEPAITEEKDRRIYRWASSNKERPSEEEQQKRQKAQQKEPPAPTVQMTTFQNWDEIGRWYAGLEKDRVTPSKEIREKAAELTKGKNTELEKIEALYNYVATNFRYVSLSFGVGRIQPHAAAEVFANQYGDCKDKHTLLAALLEAAGIRSSAVLIPSQRKLDKALPSPSQFDHVITLAYAPGAQKHEDALVWLDTTTEVAPFRLLSPNLRDKSALVVNRVPLPWESRKAGPELAEIPRDPPFTSTQEVAIDAKISELGKLTACAKYSIRGDAELFLRLAFRRTAQNKWKDLAQYLAYADGFRGQITDVKAADPSATAEPFRYEFEISYPGFLDFSSKKAQIAVPLPSLGLPAAGEDEDEKEKDKDETKDKIELGSPLDVAMQLKLEIPARYSARLPVAIGVSRDYADYRSSYKFEQNVLRAERVMHFKLSELPGTRRNDYRAFARAVRNDENQELLLESSVAGTPAIPETAKADELYTTGLAAMQSGNFAVATELLKKVAELEPKHKTVWNDLGRVYLAQRDFAQSEAAFKKQIEVDPYDQFAYNNLGSVYWLQQKYDAAEAAFRKQIEVNPLDRAAHAALGEMLNEQKKFAQATPELERAAAISPQDVGVQVALGTALLNTGESEKAMAAFDRAVEISPSPVIWNNIAYQLSLKNVSLDRAQQYAESAVTTTAAALRNVSLENVTLREMGLVNSIAAYWDTLGWVHFQRGDIDTAEKYVRASWMLSRHGEVGDHLAQILEKRGQKEEAIFQYAAALAGTRPPLETRSRLEAANAKKYGVDMLIENAKETAKHWPMDNFSLEWSETEDARGQILIAVSAGTPGIRKGAKIDEVKFLSGDDRLKIVIPRLAGHEIPGAFPDSTPTKLVRKGSVSCSSKDKLCSIRLQLPDEVTSVN